MANGLTFEVRDHKAKREFWSKQLVGNTGLISAAISGDGRLVAVGTLGGDVILWSLETRELVWEQKALGSGINGLKFAPGGHSLIAGSQAGELSVWSVLDGLQLYRRQGLAPIQRLAVSPKGVIAASTMGDHYIYGDFDTVFWVPSADRAASPDSPETLP